jgi:phosphatidylglycerol lysyltransferase
VVILLAINKKKILKTVKFLFPLFLLFLATYEIKKFISQVDLQLLEKELEKLDLWMLLFVLVVTFAAFLPILNYDVALIKILKARVSKKELLEKSLIANSFSNFIGFGGLVGAMLRTYFFHEHEQDKRKLITVIASISLFYLTGMSVLSWIVAIEFPQFPLFTDSRWIYFAVIAICLYLPLILFIQRMNAKKGQFAFIHAVESLKLIIISFIEWSAIFFSIFFLTKILDFDVMLSDLFPVYVAAACVGIISMIPGGLGSFDLVFIWGMQDLQISDEKVLILLLFYRIGYYFVPFIIGFILLIKYYWKRWNNHGMIYR